MVVRKNKKIISYRHYTDPRYVVEWGAWSTEQFETYREAKLKAIEEAKDEQPVNVYRLQLILSYDTKK